MNKRLKTGDVWPFHYRGSMYHFNPKGEVWWRAYMGEKPVECKSGHEGIVKKLLEVKLQGGSFRITEERDVITKKVEGDLEELPDYEAYFVCKLTGEMRFKHVDINPSNIKPGDIWSGFYDGATYHIGSSRRIWWREPGGVRWHASDKTETLADMLSKHKWLGGSFKINEYGHVIALLYQVPYPERIAQQISQLSVTQKEIVELKKERIRMVPIYIGPFDGKLDVQEPEDLEEKWTDEKTTGLIESLRALGRR